MDVRFWRILLSMLKMAATRLISMALSDALPTRGRVYSCSAIPITPRGACGLPARLRRLGEICLRHDVIVVADEIHCELTFPGYRFTPYATIGEEFAARCVCCNSPSKAFNTAGLQIANIVCRDEAMRCCIDRAINDNEVCDVNPFGVAALIAAYNEGEQWLGEPCGISARQL